MGILNANVFSIISWVITHFIQYTCVYRSVDLEGWIVGCLHLMYYATVKLVGIFPEHIRSFFLIHDLLIFLFPHMLLTELLYYVIVKLHVGVIFPQYIIRTVFLIHVLLFFLFPTLLLTCLPFRSTWYHSWIFLGSSFW